MTNRPASWCWKRWRRERERAWALKRLESEREEVSRYWIDVGRLEAAYAPPETPSRQSLIQRIRQVIVDWTRVR